MSEHEITIEQGADQITKALRGEKEALSQFGFLFPDHLIVAHAKHLTGKWFRWRLTAGDRQLAICDLVRMYRPRRHDIGQEQND